MWILYLGFGVEEIKSKGKRIIDNKCQLPAEGGEPGKEGTIKKYMKMQRWN